jgi:hypothetical protein
MTTTQLAPIAIVAYNRPSHLQRTIEALQQNKEAADSELYVFSDAARDESQAASVAKVRAYLKRISGFKTVQIIERTENFGLARSVISTVDQMLTAHEQVIVLEDDLVTSKFFLQYMNGALNLYAEDVDVASIHGYFYDLGEVLPDTFFLRGADCLGWGTWRRAWQFFEPDGALLLRRIKELRLTQEFDLDDSYAFTDMLKNQIAGKTNSWAIRWHASAFVNNMFTLNPGVSHVMHIGNDGSGTNFGTSDFLDTALANRPTPLDKLVRREDLRVRAGMRTFFRKHFPKLSLGKRFAASAKRILRKIINRIKCKPRAA